MKYDKSICINNIYALTKEKNVKIGDLEAKANMSAGYLSRLNKKENTTNPGIDALAIIADELGVTLDILVSINIEALTSTEKYFLKIVQKLLNDTEIDKITWKCDAKFELLDPSYDNQLTTVRYDEMSEMEYVCYNHVAPTDESVDISGNFYRAELYPHVWLAITNVKYSDKNDVHEIFIQEGNREVVPLCSTYAMREELAGYIDKLYNAAAKAITRPAINGGVKDILDAYLEGKAYEAKGDDPVEGNKIEIPDEEIPF